jgi:hypothetical protein
VLNEAAAAAAAAAASKQAGAKAKQHNFVLLPCVVVRD